MDGGITTPMAPPAAIRAQEKAAGYPAFTRAGIMIRPKAATVAGPEPEIAAKKQETTTQTMAMPPRMWPRHGVQRLTRTLRQNSAYAGHAQTHGDGCAEHQQHHKDAQ